MERAMQTYVKYLQKRVPGEFKDTPYPTANLGSTMIRQSDDMPRDSELANRLASKLFLSGLDEIELQL